MTRARARRSAATFAVDPGASAELRALLLHETAARGMSVLEGAMRNVTHTTVLSVIAYTAAIGCDSGAPRKEEVFSVLESNASNEKHTLCGSCSQSWCEGPETYSFP